MWVRAMHSYYLVCKVVAPKRAMLADANAQLEEVMIELNTARAKLAEVRFPCIHIFKRNSAIFIWDVEALLCSLIYVIRTFFSGIGG